MNPPRRFLLNDRPAALEPDAGGAALAWLRYRHGLVGTKEGCGEGECGACTVLLGEPAAAADAPDAGQDAAPGDAQAAPGAPAASAGEIAATPADDGPVAGHLEYRAVVACLLPVAELPGRHLVTIEGLSPPAGLNPIQQALVDAGAPQCGFCFPGIVISLTGFFLTSRDLARDDAIGALDGNICRCTGYTAILRAVDELCRRYAPRLDSRRPRVAQLVDWGILPPYFMHAPARLAALGETAAEAAPTRRGQRVLCGGGTDLLVQQPELIAEPERASGLVYLSRRRELSAIRRTGDYLVIGGGVTIEALRRDAALAALVPVVPAAIERFASTVVRNRATVAGNLVNASPIGDVTVLLLALDAEIVLRAKVGRGRERILPLGEFYLAYKTLALRANEVLTAVRVPLGVGGDQVSFEKISQRRFLDIASVNSAARVQLAPGGEIASVTLAVGGVAPVPLLARRTMRFLTGRRLDAGTVREAATVLDGEIAPIDDVRGTAAYKRELARRCLFAHALRVAPDQVRCEELV